MEMLFRKREDEEFLFGTKDLEHAPSLLADHKKHTKQYQ